MMTRRTFVAATAAAATATPAAATPPFRVPAEERPHERTFMQWPTSRKVYSGSGFLQDTQATIASIANTIADFEPVVLLADKSDHAHISKHVSANIDLWDIPTEDLWCRDAGPCFAQNGRTQRVHNFNFNGWGNRQTHTRDGKIAARVAQHLGLALHDTGLVGEPGGVESDDHGTLIAHESSWVNKNRNRLPKAEIENRLLAAYGATKMVWAPGIWNEDITDYHIDSLARFSGPNRILIQLIDNPDPADPWQTVPHKTHDILRANRAATGRAFDITVIPEPQKRRVKTPDFVASYANYYVCNGAVIAAQFGDPRTDQAAKHALRAHYPDREIVTLNVDILGELGGGIHCATQQQPKL
jgi:agmatine deiminase